MHHTHHAPLHRYSDNFGATWKSSSFVKGEGGDESQVAQCHNGSLIMNMRTKGNSRGVAPRQVKREEERKGERRAEESRGEQRRAEERGRERGEKKRDIHPHHPHTLTPNS
jgi:hypothetical protein